MQPTVLCPLTIPPHEHELLESKRGVNYIRCDRFLSHVYFKSPLAKEWLSSHAAKPTPNPSAPAAERSWGSEDQEEHGGLEMPTYNCPRCGQTLKGSESVCPNCDETIRWQTDDEEDLF